MGGEWGGGGRGVGGPMRGDMIRARGCRKRDRGGAAGYTSLGAHTHEHTAVPILIAQLCTDAFARRERTGPARGGAPYDATRAALQHRRGCGDHAGRDPLCVEGSKDVVCHSLFPLHTRGLDL